MIHFGFTVGNDFHERFQFTTGLRYWRWQSNKRERKSLTWTSVAYITVAITFDCYNLLKKHFTHYWNICWVSKRSLWGSSIYDVTTLGGGGIKDFVTIVPKALVIKRRLEGVSKIVLYCVTSFMDGPLPI
jgi:hypothetical protein